MGRAALLTALTLGVAACSPGEAVVGHADLACSSCHQGPVSDRGMASVPSETCTTGSCHAPATLVSAADGSMIARFEHSTHDSIEKIAVGCAGCHAHEAGGDPIPGDVGNCGLCHQDELAGPGEGCRSCHVELTHEGVTSQGLVIPHQGFPPFEKGCLRCHYQVSEPVPEVAVERCESCHDDRTTALQAGIGTDLHPSHESISCRACHEADTHRIESMSSAVSLRCSDCHSDEHGFPIDGREAWSPVCIECHRSTHRDEQAVLLGIEPGSDSPKPAEHFAEGLTCSSCHASGSGTHPVRSADQGAACESCHRRGYATVEKWWREGIRDRLDVVDAYLARAEAVERRRNVDDEEKELLESVRARIELVRSGEGVHNIDLAHNAFLDAIAAAERVLRGAGIGAPPPDMGGRPSQGFCSYCHYTLDNDQARWDTPFVFHRN